MEATLPGGLPKSLKKHDRNYSIIVAKVAYSITLTEQKA